MSRLALVAYALAAAVPIARGTVPPRATGPALATEPARATERARATEVEAWARALVGDNDPRTGTRELAARWLALVAAEPDHPLAEATLRLVAFDPELVASSSELREAALALEPGRMSFRARGELARLQAQVRARLAPLDGEPADAYPGWLARFRVLGPLGPLDDVDGARREDARLADPGFDRPHAGARGEALAWRDAARAPLEPGTPRLDLLLGAGGGHALLAFEFESERAAPAWLEIDARSGRGAFLLDAASTQRAPWTATVVDPSFDWSFNAVERGRVDFREAPRSALELAPVRVARGANVLVISIATGAGSELAVRVLGLDGEPLDGVSQPVRSSSSSYDGVRPPDGPDARRTDSVSALEGLASRGPAAEAVLGVLTVLDGRSAAGLAHVEAALDAAPDDAALASILATVVRDAPHLADAWRQNRARELYARAVELDPRTYRAGIELAKRLASEDKLEDAIERLQALGEAAPEREDAWLELESVFDRLQLTVHAERALERVFAAPAPSWRAYDRAVARLDRAGRATSAYQALVRAVRSVGATQVRLAELAARAAALGLADEAEAWHRARVARAAIASPRVDLADFLVERGKLAEADLELARAERLAPLAAEIPRRRAALAHRRGEREAERTHLERVLALAPSDRSAARELAALDAEGPLDAIDARRREIEERSRAAYASYDPTRWNDSVVRVLDWSDVEVFADGGQEMLTHTILHLRDLQACEAEGTQSLPGEVLLVHTRKRDGRVVEPIEVDGEHVMPALEPGDFVEHVTVVRAPPPADGIVRFPRWHFASVDEPFHLSHYSVVAPASLGLAVAERHFGELVDVETLASPGDAAAGDPLQRWTYESHDAPRIVPEPGAPPPQHFLPSVELGVAPDRERIAAALAAFSALSARVTPPIEAECRTAIEVLAGDDARARKLYARVGELLDRRNPTTFASATCALATREGNPVWLYSALLDAAGIDHEVVFSRDRDPAADLDADAAFYDASRWLGRMLVRVRPRNGPDAWCDPSSKTLPYGKLVAGAPRAECFGTRSRRFFAAPDVPLIDRVGQRLDVELTVAADGSAEVEIALLLTGNVAFAQKETMREVPDAQRRQIATQIGAWVVPGLDLEGFDLDDLESADRPLVFSIRGQVKDLVDDAGDGPSLRFPLPQLLLARQLAGGEGERELPYFLGDALVQSAEVRLALPEGLALEGAGPAAQLSFDDGTYTLSTRHAEVPNAWIVRRDLALPPFLIPAERYAFFSLFTSAVDEVERGRVRLARKGP